MKYAISPIAFIVALVGVHVVAAPIARSSFTSLQLRDLDRYVRITDRPFEMQDSTVLFCQPPDAVARDPHEPVHPKRAFCNVYVNKLGRDAMLTGKGTYPAGSIVIKSKLATIDSKKAELFTVMQKMDAGYDVEHGDWKYFVVDGESNRQIASGRIDSCIECHAQYKETDYITRTYLAAKR